MADTFALIQNDDGSATLHVCFDVTGIQCDPELTINETDYPLPQQSAPWTVETGQTFLGPQIAASRSAFLAAAPNFVPPSADGEQ
jgi:hypothetical protein